MTVAFGAVGYLMKKWQLPTAALILSFVLGKNINSAGADAVAVRQWPVDAFRTADLGYPADINGVILVFGLYTTIKNKRGLWRRMNQHEGKQFHRAATLHLQSAIVTTCSAIFGDQP